VATLVVLAACGGGQQQEAGVESVQEDSVALATEQFDASVFDTLTWATDTSALNRGRVVYAFSCRKCHGSAGLGDGGFVLQGDTLHPPSLVAPDWKFASDPAGLRLQVFTGNTEGMPHWGMVGLKMRDIDAVTRYILEELRAPPGAGS
jgi:mono/diheme cytochrome c family protein